MKAIFAASIALLVLYCIDLNFANGKYLGAVKNVIRQAI